MRLTKITTRTGDDGTTGLADGSRLPKDSPRIEAIGAEQVAHLDALTEQFNADLSPLKEFILPGGSRAAALCHVARTVCRRAERNCVALAHKESVSPAALQYLNRLSDLLFVLCRVVNGNSGQPDVLWQPGPSS